MKAEELGFVFCGGALGALARAGLSEAFPHAPGTWPWVTFAVNVAGAAILAFVVTRLHEGLIGDSRPRTFLGTGFCGALTTFSTLQIELLQMLDRDELGLAAGYLAASVAAGLLAAQLVTTAVDRA